jgi:creatinine amidohydrolase
MFVPWEGFAPENTQINEMLGVIPTAAIEQHGPHLPLETDVLIGQGLLAEAARLDRSPDQVLVMPMQDIGLSDEHSAFAGTKTLRPDVFMSQMEAMGENAAQMGLRKIVLINSHGGNGPALQMVCLQLRKRFAMLAVTTNWMRFGLPEGWMSPQEQALDIHAGCIETSLMLALHPDKVKRDACTNFSSRQHDLQKQFRHLRAYGPVSFGWMAQDLNPQGAMGDASRATADFGRAIIAHQARAFLELLDDMRRFDLTWLKERA